MQNIAQPAFFSIKVIAKLTEKLAHDDTGNRYKEAEFWVCF